MDLYEFAKDFAAPITTGPASIIAAAAAGTFAYRQWKTANLQAEIALNKLKYDTFAARHDALDAAIDLIKTDLSHQARSADRHAHIVGPRTRMEHSRFYFGDEIQDIMQSIALKADYLDNLIAINETTHADPIKFGTMKIDDLSNDLASMAYDLPRFLSHICPLRS